MPADLELVVEVDVNKANASIKSVNTGLSSMQQAASKAAHDASAWIDGMTASMVNQTFTAVVTQASCQPESHRQARSAADRFARARAGIAVAASLSFWGSIEYLRSESAFHKQGSDPYDAGRAFGRGAVERSGGSSAWIPDGRRAGRRRVR
jgi:hypothetical protein